MPPRGPAPPASRTSAPGMAAAKASVDRRAQSGLSDRRAAGRARQAAQAPSRSSVKSAPRGARAGPSAPPQASLPDRGALHVVDLLVAVAPDVVHERPHRRGPLARSRSALAALDPAAVGEHAAHRRLVEHEPRQPTRRARRRPRRGRRRSDRQSVAPRRPPARRPRRHRTRARASIRRRPRSRRGRGDRAPRQ